jgi:peptide/nickel transport system ATP-binding protein
VSELTLASAQRSAVEPVDAAAPSVLEIQNLSVHFPLRHTVLRAVDDVSLVLRRGRTTCVVGESGSGKSVTARAILQIVDPPGRITGGRILMNRHATRHAIAGQSDAIDLARLAPKSRAIRAIRGREIAMIFQEPMSSLSPVHRIGDQIGEAIRLHEPISRRQARERAVELLRKVEIPKPEAAVDRYPFEYSGGMRQRAMIAMALSCNPSVLIADEPTTALDVTTQAEILDLMSGLQRDFGMAVMFITHDMGVVAEIADDVVVMYQGKVRETGPVESIFHAPQDDYTKMLLDSVLKLGKRAPQRPPPAPIPADAKPILRVEGLSMTFGASRSLFGRKTEGSYAVKNVSFDLQPGESLGIVGESGSGKTTLGRCIARIYEPSAGRVLYRETAGGTTDLVTLGNHAMRPYRKAIRMIFQDPFASLNPRMTVGQIVAEPLLVNNIAKGSELEGRVEHLLRQVGLPVEAMERYPHAFSGGQRQRVGIARAIALEPRIVIADEATSALDVSIRTQVLDLLIELQKKLDLSFLFVSHDIAVIRYFCDRIAVMYRGELVEAGDADRICEAPEHPYTQALLSAVPAADPRQKRIARRVRY